LFAGDGDALDAEGGQVEEAEAGVSDGFAWEHGDLARSGCRSRVAEGWSAGGEGKGRREVWLASADDEGAVSAGLGWRQAGGAWGPGVEVIL